MNYAKLSLFRNFFFALIMGSCNDGPSVADSFSGKVLASLDSSVDEGNRKKQSGSSGLPTQYLNSGVALREILQNHSTAVDRKILIDKSERKLGLYLGKIILKEYPVSLGFDPENDKIQEGDGRTPEGEFYVNLKMPNSRFHKALQISYPQKEDASRGLEAGLIDRSEYESINQAIDTCTSPPQKTPLGGYIQIHGGGALFGDWTLGCIALNNDAMDEVYNFAQGGCRGTKILIQK